MIISRPFFGYVRIAFILDPRNPILLIDCSFFVETKTQDSDVMSMMRAGPPNIFLIT